MRRILHTIQGLSRPGSVSIVLLIGVVLACQGCVSKGKYAVVIEERDACTVDKGMLEERIHRVEAENEVLATELEIGKEVASLGRTLYEELVSGLETEVAANQVTIQQMRSGITVHLCEAVLFPSGSAELTESGGQVLLKMAEDLRDVPLQTIVVGFTDNVPIGGQLGERYTTNWELAGARATRVVRLLEEGGVARERLLAISLGENQPIASNDTPEGRTRNRRIEIRLRPIVVED